MIDYTWKYPASEQEIAAAKSEAEQLVQDTADAQQEMQVIMQAFEALTSQYEVDVEFGREVFRIFREVIGR